MSDLICRQENTTGRITLNRPDALNALTHDMCLEMEAQLRIWADDPVITQILVDASGDKAFSAGGDIQHLYDNGKKGDYAFGQKFWADEYRLNHLIASYPKPYVVFMQGFVMGGGVGVSCHGSHRIVGETTQIALPECSIGLIPDVGSSYLLAKAPGHLGEYLGLTGVRMDAGNAVFAGFADHFVQQDDWPQLMAQLISDGHPRSIASFEQTLPPAKLRDHLDHINAVFNTSNLGEIMARLAAVPNDEFMAKTYSSLSRSSPLSMATSLRVIAAVRESPSIETALDWEYRVTARSTQYGDFLEGIRAAIIDKDRQPNWRLASVDAVTADELAVMLAPFQTD